MAPVNCRGYLATSLSQTTAKYASFAVILPLFALVGIIVPSYYVL